MLNPSSSRQSDWIPLGIVKLVAPSGESSVKSEYFESEIRSIAAGLELNQAVIEMMTASLEGAARGIEQRNLAHFHKDPVEARILVSQRSVELCKVVTRLDPVRKTFEEKNMPGSQGWGFFIIEHFEAADEAAENKRPMVLVDLYLYLEDGIQDWQ